MAKINPSKAKAAILQNLLAGDISVRKLIFLDEFKEILQYGFSKDYGFAYQSLPKDAFFRAKVALTAQAIKVLGPYLYQNNPHRTVTIKPWADNEQTERSKIVEDYLNYTPKEYNAYAEDRKAIDDGVCGGGVLWTERCVKKPQVISSVHVSIRDIVFDGDATSTANMRRVWRRRLRPRSEAIAEYPEAEKEFKAIQKASTKFASDCEIPGEPNKVVGDMIEYYEGYFNSGLSSYDEKGTLVEEIDPETGEPVVDDTPTKFLVTKDGRLIHQCDWEIPFYRDGLWPCSVLGFYTRPSSPYPVGPLTDALGFQKAINWIVTLMMGKFKFTSRTLMALVKKNGVGLSQGDADKVLVGNDIEAISLKIDGENKNIGDFIQQFNWDSSYLDSGMKFLSLMEEYFQKASGLYDILYAGQSDTQSRTATDANVKDRNSMSRVNDMRDKIATWRSEAVRKEALAARFLLNREDIRKVLGKPASEKWGFLVKPEMKDVNKWVEMLMQQGLPMEDAVAMAQEKVKDAVDMDSWALEIDYNIEADSMRRRDIDQKIDSLKELMNQTVPTLLGSPDPIDRAFAFDIMAEYHEAIGSPRSLVMLERQRAEQLRATPPMPPQMPPPPQAPPA
jgi:hypothetical protein